MEAKALRLPILSIVLSLSVSFCARADICFDTISGVQGSAYIEHIGEDDNVLEVEVKGNCKVKSLRPVGDSGATGIPRDKMRIRIPEIKLNFVENPHAEYHEFFELMEEVVGLNGQHEGFLNTKIVITGMSIEIDTEEYMDYSTTGSFETVFINNREYRVDDAENWQPIGIVIPDPPEISLYYKNEEELGERYIYSALPDEFLFHDIYLGAYAVHIEQSDRLEQMMERMLRLRYRDRYYQFHYALHDPTKEAAGPSAENTSYQELTENLSYLSLPELGGKQASGSRAGRASGDAEAERYAFVGWKLTELGEGTELYGPCRSEETGLPLTKRNSSPMISFFGPKSAALHEDICSEAVMAEAAMVTIEAQKEAQKTQLTTEMQQTPEEAETQKKPLKENAPQEAIEKGGDEETRIDENATLECPDSGKIASPSSL